MRKCNNVLNIGLLHFPLLLDSCFLAFYTTIAFKCYMYTTNFLNRERCCLVVTIASDYNYSTIGVVSAYAKVNNA